MYVIFFTLSKGMLMHGILLFPHFKFEKRFHKFLKIVNPYVCFSAPNSFYSFVKYVLKEIECI